MSNYSPSRDTFTKALATTQVFCTKHNITMEELMWQVYKSLPTTEQVILLTTILNTIDVISIKTSSPRKYP